MDSGLVFVHFLMCCLFLSAQAPHPALYPIAQAPGAHVSLIAIKSQIPVVSDFKVLQHLLARRIFANISGINVFLCEKSIF